MRQLNLGDVIYEYDDNKLAHWLEKPNSEPFVYPNVANAIVNWLENGQSQNPSQLAKELWSQVGYADAHPD